MKKTDAFQSGIFFLIIFIYPMHHALAQHDIYRPGFIITVESLTGYRAIQLTHYRIGLNGQDIYLRNQPVMLMGETFRTPFINTNLPLPTNNRMTATIGLTFHITSPIQMHIPNATVRVEITQTIQHIVGLNYIAEINNIHINTGDLQRNPPTVLTNIINNRINFRDERRQEPIFNLNFSGVMPAIRNESILGFIFLGSQ